MGKQSSRKPAKSINANISKLLRFVKLAETKRFALEISENAMKEAEETYKNMMEIQKNIKEEYKKFIN